jgi:hypothetical protein
MAVPGIGWRAGLCLLTGWLALPASAHADGTTLRASRGQDRVRVSVFTRPDPVRVGELDVNVLVQQEGPASRGAQVGVVVQAYLVADPAQRVSVVASRGEGADRIFQTAKLELPRAGLWQVDVEAEGVPGSMQVGFELPVEEMPSSWGAFGAVLGLPAAGVLLYSAHQWLVGRRQRPPAPA